MKNILVLGGFGFIGSNLLNYIDHHKQHDCNVIVFDKQPVHPFGLKFQCVSKVYSGDFGNRQDVDQIFEENRIDRVFHFLNTTVPATSFDIRFDIESNLLATIGLLESMLSHSVGNIIFISSGGAIYGNTLGLCHVENEDTFPLSSYGIVKLAIEKYIHMFSHRNSLSYLILRLSNPFGPFHYSMKQGMINVAIRKAIQREKFTVWGDGTNRKDYIFVEDFVDILMKLIELNVRNEVINIGSGCLYSINNILEKVKMIEPSFDWEYVNNKEFDNMTFELQTNRLKTHLGDYGYTALDDGIEKTFEWSKANL
jgi:UDP-glucose 4-epimerase